MSIHLSRFIAQQAPKNPGKTAFKHRDEQTQQWISTSWTRLAQQVTFASQALAEIGITPFDNIAIYASNKPECFIVDFAVYSNRAVIIPLYATSSVSQIEYIINEAEVKLLFVGDQKQYNNAREAMRSSLYLKQLIVINTSVKFDTDDNSSMYFTEFLKHGEFSNTEKIVAQRSSEATFDDLATIMYTSGTTGEPKGVMLTYSNMSEELHILQSRLSQYFSEKDTSLSFLPLTHIFEKMWSYYCLVNGMCVYINENPSQIQQIIKEVQPTIMCSVPRFWEKVYSATQEKIASTKGIAKILMLNAVKVGKKYNLDYKRYEKTAPLLLRLKYKFYNRIVFKKLRAAIGIPNGNLFPCAGAPISDNINEFLHSVGIDMLCGYGLTEVTGAITNCMKTHYPIPSVGQPLNKIEIKIGENDEIMVKGPVVMKGYYKKPEETAKVFDGEWFKTGDAGKIDSEGNIIITERLKDLYKTSNGKYIAPQALEAKIGEDRFIDQVAIIGDQQKYVTAIIIPAYEALKEYAHKKQIQFRDLEELLKHHSIYELIEERINELQKNFASFEQIKKFTLLPQPFTMECGELTNTLKLRRAVILARYSNVIDAMYT